MVNMSTLQSCKKKILFDKGVTYLEKNNLQTGEFFNKKKHKKCNLNSTAVKYKTSKYLNTQVKPEFHWLNYYISGAIPTQYFY